MKIERLSDNQIKFTLTEKDLSERNIEMRELSYGSEKAQVLFHEIMEKAIAECDFHTTSDTPLIIEAIPISRDGLTIIVTRVSSIEEFERRMGYPLALETYKKVRRTKDAPEKIDIRQRKKLNEKKPKQKGDLPKQIIFEFFDLDRVIEGTIRISGTNFGANSLFKYNGRYYLVFENNRKRLSPGQELALKEYGRKFSNLEMSYVFLKEYGELIIERNAVATFAKHFGADSAE